MYHSLIAIAKEAHMTIDEANKKTLRPAMSVLCGMDVPQQTITNIAIDRGSYDGVVGDTEYVYPFKPLMDLAGDGFLNDGSAEPLMNDHEGIVSGIGPLRLTVDVDKGWLYAMTVYGYENGKLKKWEFDGYRATPFTFTFSGNTRKVITHLVAGDSWWFDNSTLVSCSGVLRGIETKVENPELQMSEIEIKGYEPNDITGAIGSIGTDYPIFYSAGYVGDMSPMRKFYLSDQIEWKDNVITFKGTDATRFLDDEYAVYVGDANGESGGTKKLLDQMDAMLTNSNVIHEYRNDYTYGRYTDGYAFLFPNISKRSVLAQIVNMHRIEDWQYPFYVNYVDAGIPRLWTGKSETKRQLNFISKPSIIVEPKIGTIKVNYRRLEVEASAQIETYNARGVTYKSTSDPYYSFAASAGTISRLSPYRYKLIRTGSATINGRKITPYDPDADGLYSPLIVTFGDDDAERGITITLNDIYGWMSYRDDGATDEELISSRLYDMLNSSNILYEFEYRGDPRLQPRDYIRADVKGEGRLTDMTIDSIEFSHEGGGYKQKITARKGLV